MKSLLLAFFITLETWTSHRKLFEKVTLRIFMESKLKPPHHRVCRKQWVKLCNWQQTKWQLRRSRGTALPPRMNVGHLTSVLRVFDQNGALTLNFLQDRKATNSERIVGHWRKAKIDFLSSRNILLFQDNATPHVAKRTKETLESFGIWRSNTRPIRLIFPFSDVLELCGRSFDQSRSPGHPLRIRSKELQEAGAIHVHVDFGRWWLVLIANDVI